MSTPFISPRAFRLDFFLLTQRSDSSEFCSLVQLATLSVSACNERFYIPQVFPSLSHFLASCVVQFARGTFQRPTGLRQRDTHARNFTTSTRWELFARCCRGKRNSAKAVGRMKTPLTRPSPSVSCYFTNSLVRGDPLMTTVSETGLHFNP